MYKSNAQIRERIGYLREAIAYSRNFNKGMSLLQGTCCHKEIASLFQLMNEPNMDFPSYSIPEHLEEKVRQIHEKITITHWKNPQEII